MVLFMMAILAKLLYSFLYVDRVIILENSTSICVSVVNDVALCKIIVFLPEQKMEDRLQKRFPIMGSIFPIAL